MEKKNLAVSLAALALTFSAGGGLVAAAHADTASTTATSGQASTQDQDNDGPNGQHQRPAAVGQVTAVNGSTITLKDMKSGTTYTVDASSATIEKHDAPSSPGAQPAAPTTISVADVQVGDMLAVEGTVSGSNIVATKIHDGVPPMGRGHGRGPGLEGTVTAVNGSTLTITGKDGKTYTVDASSASASKMTTIQVSDIQVGDTVGIQGSVNGTSVTAKHLMDGILAAPQNASSGT